MKKKAKIYDCLKKFSILDKNKDTKNIKMVKYRRNTTKIVKIFLNWKNHWFLRLDKLNRNLHIETQNQNDEINLFTDY